MALLPVGFLLAEILAVLIFAGADAVSSYSWLMLLGAALIGIIVSKYISAGKFSDLVAGLRKSAVQTMPAIPILLLIGCVSATWMFSGVVPLMIKYGMLIISPRLLLFTCCCVSAFISVLTGSSWTTIATIGVAFMGIGSAMGYSPGWIAGAVISGAYFGDKISPLSDTTVLASSSAGVDLFRHIKYMLITTLPSILISLGIFLLVGFLNGNDAAVAEHNLLPVLEQNFNLNPWIAIIPALTLLLIILRLPTNITLAVSASMALCGFFIFQPHLVETIAGNSKYGISHLMAAMKLLFIDSSLSTGDEMFDSLISSGGMKGILPTVLLVISAMVFGGVMIGSGFLKTISARFSSLIRGRVRAVGATAASGLLLNCATADQYLSLVIGGNMYKGIYDRIGLERRLLSRTMEDSVSVTSVLIPWNSCGVTQSAVLGVATLTYLPYCIFNWLSPLMSVAIALSGFKIVHTCKATFTKPETTLS